jgi:hypothetical protein
LGQNEKKLLLECGLTSVAVEEVVPNADGLTCTMEDFSASEDAQRAERGRLQVRNVSPIVTNPAVLT